MKRIITGTLVLVLGVCLAVGVYADDAAKNECMEKTKAAAKMINEKGLDAAVAEINNKEGMFVSKATYVFLMDLEGKMVAHPMKASLIGKNLLETPDKAGKMFFKDFIDIAKNKGEGWVDYMWPKPGAKEPSQKTSFIYRVPGKDLLVGAGIYK